MKEARICEAKWGARMGEGERRTGCARRRIRGGGRIIITEKWSVSGQEKRCGKSAGSGAIEEQPATTGVVFPRKAKGGGHTWGTSDYEKREEIVVVYA